MGILKKFGYLLLIGVVISCTKDDEPTNSSEPPARDELTAVELEFLDEYEYITYNFSPTSFGADLNEKWDSNINIFLDGEISNDYSNGVAEALGDFNGLFGENSVLSGLVNSFEASNIHLIFGEKEAIAEIWPDMYNTIRDGGFSGYALYNRDNSFGIISGRIWVRSASIALFKHELGHLIGLGHASDGYCGGSSTTNSSIMCSSLSTDFSAFDKAIVKTLYRPEVEKGKTFSELRPVIENLLLTGEISID